jgi:hypothetical protein
MFLENFDFGMMKMRKFGRRSDFSMLGWAMLEEARRRAECKPKELEKETMEAWKRLEAGDFSGEDKETLELLKKVDAKYKKLIKG